MKTFFKRLFGLPTKPSKQESPAVTAPCCSEQVHIAYRGISDDRLYLSYDRKWREVKFFKPHGLRIFCAVCRRQIHLDK